jgi:hypothetical protein
MNQETVLVRLREIGVRGVLLPPIGWATYVEHYRKQRRDGWSAAEMRVVIVGAVLISMMRPTQRAWWAKRWAISAELGVWSFPGPSAPRALARHLHTVGSTP